MARLFHQFKYRHAARENIVCENTFTIIAHRGASAYYPENTLMAFAGAILLGAQMVELDVQLTADGEVVVFHDEKISRCTDGSGRIADHTLSQLKKLDAGSWFDKTYQGERIPTLAEVLEVCRSVVAVNIEIKTEAVKDEIAGGIEEKSLQLVDQAGMDGHVVFSSFDPRALRHLRQIDPQTPVAILYEKKHYGLHRPSQIVESVKADAFNCSMRELTAKWREDLNHHDIPVNVYTVNTEKDMKRMLALGVSGMFTNFPDTLKKVVEEFRWNQAKNKTRL